MKQLFKGSLGLILLCAVIVYSIVFKVGFDRDFVGFFVNSLPLYLTLIAALFSLFFNKGLIASIILLITFYSGTGSGFVSALFNNFSNITFKMLIDFLIFIYLIVFICFNAHGMNSKKIAHKALTYIMAITFLYLYFRDGFASSLLVMLPILLAYVAGSYASLLLLVIAATITVPFYLASYFIQNMNLHANWNTTLISTLIFGIIGIYVLVRAIALLPEKLVKS